MQDFDLPYVSDDGTLTKESPLYRVSKLCVDASIAAGRPINLASEYKSYLESIGFVNVEEHRFKWPLNEWPKDPYFKELGAWTQENLNGGIEGLIMALLTRHLDWSQNEVLIFCSEVRAALRDRMVHGYIPM